MDSSLAPLAPNTKDNNEGRENSGSNQNDNKAPANRKKKKGIPTISSEVKCAHLGTSEGLRYPGRSYSLKHAEPYVRWEFCSGDASCAHKCICSDHTEHTYWSFVSHSPLLKLVD